MGRNNRSRRSSATVPDDEVGKLVSLYPECGVGVLERVLKSYGGDVHLASEALLSQRQAGQLSNSDGKRPPAWEVHARTSTPSPRKGDRTTHGGTSRDSRDARDAGVDLRRFASPPHLADTAAPARWPRIDARRLEIHVRGIPWAAPCAEIAAELEAIFEPDVLAVRVPPPTPTNAAGSDDRLNRGVAYVDLTPSARALSHATDLALLAESGELAIGGRRVSLEVAPQRKARGGVRGERSTRGESALSDRPAIDAASRFDPSPAAAAAALAAAASPAQRFFLHQPARGRRGGTRAGEGGSGAPKEAGRAEAVPDVDTLLAEFERARAAKADLEFQLRRVQEEERAIEQRLAAAKRDRIAKALDAVGGRLARHVAIANETMAAVPALVDVREDLAPEQIEAVAGMRRHVADLQASLAQLAKDLAKAQPLAPNGIAAAPLECDMSERRASSSAGSDQSAMDVEAIHGRTTQLSWSERLLSP